MSVKLKKGFTTGTCAQAATKAACIMLAGRKVVKSVKVATPSGKKLNIGVINQRIGKGFAQCAVIKDSGDDPDVTHGIKICAKVRLSDKAGITLRGAQGIGRATKPGLAVRVGEWAINPVPRKMIFDEAAKFLSKEKPGLKVTISAPKGEELAKRTFNPKLGIRGGISIIGTTGIVEPKSLDAYRASLSLELNVLKAQGHKKAVFVLGYVGERFCKEKLKLNSDSLIKIGDHIGFMLEECVKKEIEEVLLIGHIGKLIKITKGQFNAHYSQGDNRLESIARYAAFLGAKKNIIEKILGQETAEACIPLLREAGLNGVFKELAKDIARKSEELLHNRVTVNCILLSLTGEVLARSHEK